ncbi:uncharacterized membrane protein HdeD (DUF308 family) [Nitrobacteraceae bacterium AZCC 1564]
MSTYGNSASVELTRATPPLWACIMLGVGLIVIALLVLADVAFFTLVSTIFIGWMAIAAGVFEIGHAFWTKGWGEFVWQIVLGILYVAFGIVLITQPVISALILTYILALMLILSGIIRFMIGVKHWRQSGWIILLSGVFGVLAGLIVLTGFPASGLWVLGLLLGIDLLSHGLGWLTYALHPATRTA